MTTLSVPLPAHLEEFINSQVKSGRASNKADVVRKALNRLAEDEAVQNIITAEKELRDGKGLRGDLRQLLKKI